MAGSRHRAIAPDMRLLSTYIVSLAGPAAGGGRLARALALVGIAENFGASHPGPGPLDWLGRQAGMPANFLVRLRWTSFVPRVVMQRFSTTLMREVSTSDGGHSMQTLTGYLANL